MLFVVFVVCFVIACLWVCLGSLHIVMFRWFALCLGICDLGVLLRVFSSVLVICDVIVWPLVIMVCSSVRFRCCLLIVLIWCFFCGLQVGVIL